MGGWWFMGKGVKRVDLTEDDRCRLRVFIVNEITRLGRGRTPKTVREVEYIVDELEALRALFDRLL